MTSTKRLVSGSYDPELPVLLKSHGVMGGEVFRVPYWEFVVGSSHKRHDLMSHLVGTTGSMYQDLKLPTLVLLRILCPGLSLQ